MRECESDPGLGDTNASHVQAPPPRALAVAPVLEEFGLGQETHAHRCGEPLVGVRAGAQVGDPPGG